MDKKRLEHFKHLLLEERKAAIDTLERMNENEPNTSFKDYFDELSVYDNHPADIGTELFQMEMNFNLKENEKLHLKEIDHALQKIEDGTYGQCITCGKEIPEERLEILPTAVQCMECEKDRLSIHMEIDTRPVEEEVLSPPFGRSFKDHDSRYNGFDGEDAWQEVARFNKTDAHRMALDWYDNNMYDENVSGTPEDVDRISQEYYMGQLEEVERKDIPHDQRKKK
ncbi:TraR/DksA C4-type zinc finger protein [Thermotalea metallivorans]|uniref:General stress protein 16O n=1 Tax=Thermotalea metallivorans TaxID=520762 RepID=A0A140L5Z6_9FIRM|nr:TraR/DksA C4-type zinc finger protein [Thermotalea metallivorans]KXG75971.1 General stress protein 16O [Thermotalea metallivorans]